MLNVLLETAPQQGFTFSPLLIIALAAPIALALTVFLVRFLRKGNK